MIAPSCGYSGMSCLPNQTTRGKTADNEKNNHCQNFNLIKRRQHYRLHTALVDSLIRKTYDGKPILGFCPPAGAVKIKAKEQNEEYKGP